MKKVIFALMVLFGIFAATGHSGKTDANGGHFDGKNGGYHYHGTPPSRNQPTAESGAPKTYPRSTAVPQPVQVSQQVFTPVTSDAQRAETEVKTITWQKKQAEAGSATAQFDLGVRYLTGNGVAKDLIMAISLLENAAKQGNRQAKEKLEEAVQEKERMAAKPVIQSESAELDRLSKENDLLKKENQELRRLLANGGAIQAGASGANSKSATIPPQPSVSSSPNAPQASKWSLSSTGKRHNSSCRYYDASKATGSNNGVACKLCGG